MADSKNVYELINEMKLNLDEYEKEEISDIEKKNLKRNFRKNINRKLGIKKFGIVAVALVLTISIISQTSFGKNVYAAAQSKLSDISYSISKALGTKKDIEPYANVVNQTVSSNGIEIKLTDVIIDKDELIFSTIVNTDRPVEGLRLDFDFSINGKRIRNYAGTGTFGPVDGSKTLHYTLDLIDIKGIDTEGDIDIKIRVYGLYFYTGNSDEEVEGEWVFEFTANGSELMENTYITPIDYSFNIDAASYNLKEFRYNPVTQKILGRVENKSKEFYHVELRGFDNLGNDVVFYLSSLSGNELVFRYENIYNELSDEITSITLTPYAAKLPEESGRMSNDYKIVGEEFTILLNR